MENKEKSDNSNLETIAIINCVVNVPLMLIAIIANALVLFAILRTSSLRSVPSTVFICSLAIITDLLVGLALQPIYIASEFQHSSGSLLLKTREFMANLLCGVSLSTMTAISVDRCLALRCHVLYPNLMTTKRALYSCASLCFVSMFLSCLSIWRKHVGVFIVTGLCIVICFVISFAAYIEIYVIVRHHEIQIHTQHQAVNSFCPSPDTPNNHNMAISKKSAINTFIYFICMIFCYSPYLIYLLLRITLVISFERNWLTFVIATVVFLNSSINPFLYCWRNREIRTSVVKIVRKMNSVEVNRQWKQLTSLSLELV